MLSNHQNEADESDQIQEKRDVVMQADTEPTESTESPLKSSIKKNSAKDSVLDAEEPQLTTHSKIEPKHHAVLKKFLFQIEDQPQSYEFRVPLPAQFYEGKGLTVAQSPFTSGHTVITVKPGAIKKRMDLHTVRKNLSKKKYGTFSEFFKDVNLIWENALKVTPEGSDLNKQALFMRRFARKEENLLKEKLGMPWDHKIRLEESSDMEDWENKYYDPNCEEDLPAVIGFDEKVKFVYKIRQLPNEGLTRLIEATKDLREGALEDVDDEKIRLNIDKLNWKTFNVLNAIANEYVKDIVKDDGKKLEPAVKRLKLD